MITLINFYDQRVFTPRNNKRRIIRVDGSSICLNQLSVHFRNMSRNSRGRVYRPWWSTRLRIKSKMAAGRHLGKFRMAVYICTTRVNWYTSCLVLLVARVFRVGGSNGAIYDSNKSKMTATAMLEKFQVAISPQPVVRSTSCLVIVWGFRGRRI